ncbi:hypothetical protein Daus18300_007796 [Diaporthe australafricana]|uniref:RWD domain-containing protein n=1 Tax=Diaporthe australafricana TaxID=127596 RepID=A0ABR3WKY0_9PEZI
MSATVDEAKERLQQELELLEAMYPECVVFDSRGRELRYSPVADGDRLPKEVLVLRIPDHYPAKGLPDLITAKDSRGLDARTQVSAAFSKLAVVEGEESLDAFILAFQDFINESAEDCSPPDQEDTGNTRAQETKRPPKTVVIWLHHLLNTNKRKLALNPSFDAGGMSGLTKPGYPGVMVFSGPRDTVDSHVAELRSQRWQAFQVRYDSSEEAERGRGGADDDDNDSSWAFQPCARVREVETLSEMAQAISRAEHRETFLRVMGLK